MEASVTRVLDVWAPRSAVPDEKGHAQVFGHAVVRFVAALVFAAMGLGCPSPSRFAKITEARRMSATLQADFAKAVDAANRSVMADDEEASARFAEQAERTRQRVAREAESLSAQLGELEYQEEKKILDDFRSKFTAYDVLDREVLQLAVASTNVRATRLSFGPLHAAADAYEDALTGVASAASKGDAWHARSLALESVLAVRKIEVLEGPHIAEPQDAAMTRMEQQMTELAATARRALDELTKLVPAESTNGANAADALRRFLEIHAQVIALSRQNTNVRSLAMTLGQKRELTASCERSLQTLTDKLTERMSPGTK